MRGLFPQASSPVQPVRASNAGFTYSMTLRQSVIITRVGGGLDCMGEFLQGLVGQVLSLLHRVQGHRAPNAPDRGRSFQFRLGNTVPRAPFNDFRDSVFVGMLGEYDIRDGNTDMKKIGQKVDSPGISGFVFKQNQTVGPFLQHRFGFFEQVRVFQLSRKHAAHPVQNLAYQERVFLFLAEQQDAKGATTGFTAVSTELLLNGYYRNVAGFASADFGSSGPQFLELQKRSTGSLRDGGRPLFRHWNEGSTCH